MIWADIVWGAPSWIVVAVLLAIIGCGLVAWSYRVQGGGRLDLWRVGCTVGKIVAVVALAICLAEPRYVGNRPRPGANVFLVAADNSRSLRLTERNGQRRGDLLSASLSRPEGWLTRLGQDFDVRKYTFDDTLQPVDQYPALSLDGEASTIAGTVKSLRDRYRGQPVAGILLLTDGNATDAAREGFTFSGGPPIFPVALASGSSTVDLAIESVVVTQTNFEAAPVTLAIVIAAEGLAGRKFVARIHKESGEEIDKRTLQATGDSVRLTEKFLVKPDRPGVTFLEVRVALEGEDDLPTDSDRSREATLANNRRLATIDRAGGPYRVLYVGGRPSWEFKFLRRSLTRDDEIRLVGLVRIARQEPKFNFLAREGERTNPLFRGFNNKDDEQTEQYDEPVLLRLATENQEELKGGFPKLAEELFRYEAVVLDDVEAAFFSQDQLSLLQQFVSQRGGGLLMLGGQHSFGEGGYSRTPVGEMLPVYLDRLTPVADASYRLKLTRDGWLQPWLRVRSGEAEEQQRLATLPMLRSLNRVDVVKPGAVVLAEVESSQGETKPALAYQPFGRGRAAALLVGDLWRWELKRDDPARSELEASWRQTVRWLVADVPKRVEVEARRTTGAGLAPTEILVRARDERFTPLDNAEVSVIVTPPDGREVELRGEPAERNAGEYRAVYSPRSTGAHRARIVVKSPAGDDVGVRETGWAVAPETDEFRRLNGDVDYLKQLAESTGGELLTLDQLDRFVARLPNLRAPVVETWSYPIWHHWSILALAVGCLASEWGVRRWRGLP
ncbi:MAG: glutamine amidotransferase [Pirellulales bacterium]